jgi:hypothetical protein
MGLFNLPKKIKKDGSMAIPWALAQLQAYDMTQVYIGPPTHTNR